MTVVVVGRERPLAEIAEAVTAGRSVLVVGERGTGRTTVLAETARRFTADGGSVLATGVLTGDGAVPLAALQRLLAPVRDRVASLPPAARATLQALFGTGGLGHGPVPSADDLVGAVAHLTELLTAQGRWLWCIDDLHRCDPVSASVVASVSAVPVVATALSPPPGFDQSVIVLNSLTRAHSRQMLAAMPGVAAHPAVRVVAAQAAGNPLALVELARTLPEPAAVSVTVTELPVPARLRAALAPAVATLDAAEIDAALLASVAAETPSADATRALNALVEPQVWTRLTDAGVTRAGRLRRITHPVIRAAVIDRAGLAAQQQARLRLAAHLPAASAAHAWHRARGGRPLSEEHAAALERAGHALVATGWLRPAAHALVMAAEHTAPSPLARRRRNAAAHCARFIGELAWADQMDGNDTTSETSMFVLVLQAWAYGDDLSVTALRAALRAGRSPDDLVTMWAESIVEDSDPSGRVSLAIHEPEPRLRSAELSPAHHWISYGVMALGRHETAQANRFLRHAAMLPAAEQRLRGISLSTLAWAEFDGGDLDGADDSAVAALAPDDDPGGYAAIVRSGAFAVRAAIAVLQERDDQQERLRAVLDLPVPLAPVYECRLIRARGQADAIAGNLELAYRRLRRLHDGGGRPVHHRISDLGLADLVSVAVALDRADEVSSIVADAEPRVRALRSVRLTAIWQRSMALLAGAHADAETHFQLALADPGTGQWPIERAATQVDYARWLRRRRRPTAARALLEAARDAFAAARLPAWRTRADAELAAATAPAHRDPGAQLTPQQHQVVRLAAEGLTNQQIAERLALSPRTVSTHLARAFPILGVTRRSQLRAVVDPPG